MKIWNAIFLTSRFFIVFGLIVGLFAVGFFVEILFPVTQVLLVLAVILVLVDFWLLFSEKELIQAKRRLPKILSLGAQNKVFVDVHNALSQSVFLEIIDELPVQMQKRDFRIELGLDAKQTETIMYELRPLKRGEYQFGALNIYVSSRFRLIQRRVQFVAPMSVPVYPSIIQMKQLELKAFDRVTSQKGIKKIRRLGHSYEFEQIKNYVRGDDYRSINWKASSHRGSLMVNSYQDERAQQVYCLLDKSRVMRMPFDGLSLMDYAINTCLVISNIVLQKQDRAGLISFSDIIGTTIKAEKKANQLNKILSALYREKERNLEANYELLYHASRKLIKGRSLLILFTNFESSYALERVLPILRKINALHLLVVVFFDNTEIRRFTEQDAEQTEDIYLQTIAQDYLTEKAAMAQQLKKFGIQAIFTQPEELAVNTINKYLELKSRGLI